MENQFVLPRRARKVFHVCKNADGDSARGERGVYVSVIAGSKSFDMACLGRSYRFDICVCWPFAGMV